MKLCVIPARQGSKRLPRKNVLPLAGRPLVARAVDCAVQAGVFDRVVVTTDDPEVAEAVRGLVCEVRARPPALAGDAATLSEVLVALLAELAEDGASVDLIALLLPTSPLRTADDVRASLAVLEADPQANGVLSVTEYEHTPQWAYCVRDGRVVPYWAEFISQPRGDLEPLVRHDGSIMWLRASELRARGDYHFPMAPYRIPPERAVDVDTPLDFAFAEFLLSRGGPA